MDPQLDEPDLRSYLGTVSRRKWLVAAVTAVFFTVVSAMTFLAEPKYELRLNVQTRSALRASGDSNQAALDARAERELNYIRSAALAREVDRVYQGPLPLSEIDKVRAVDLGTNENRVSNTVRLSYATSDPDEGRNMLRIYADTYVAEAANEVEENLQNDVSAYQSMINDINDEIADLEAPLDELRQEIVANAGDAERVGALEADWEALSDDIQPELNQLRSDRATYESLLRDFDINSRVEDVAPARVLGFVTGGTTPVSPNIPQNLAIGMVVGLFLGVAAAFLRDYFDDSVASKDAVERVTGVPAVGLIPKFDTGETELVAVASTNSPATEAFRSLRTSVKFTSVERGARVIQVTSASAGEGKTVTAANLATVLAQAGDRVVLVSADLRRPRVEELMGIPLTPGLTGVLIGEVTLPQAVRTIDSVPNLAVLPSGQPPTNPSELLSGERARRLMEVLAQTYDIVVLDCPPLLPVTDSLVLARMADITLLVTSARSSSRRELERAVELLQRMDANLAGCVVTSLAPDDAYADLYGYDTVVPPQHTVPRGRPPVPAEEHYGAPDLAGQPAAGQSPEVWHPAPEGMHDGAAQGPAWPSELPRHN